MEDETGYAKCVNKECAWFGSSFARGPESTGKRICPSCSTELENWKDRDGRGYQLEGEGDDTG